MTSRTGTKKEYHQRVVRDFMQEHGVTEVDPDDLTAWAINTKRIPNEPSNFFRRTKKVLIEAMRDERQTDPQGREIRKMIAIKIKGEKVQKSLWFELYEAKPNRVHVALSQQRRGIVAYCRKHKQTIESYNDNNRFGAQLPLFDYNINLDLKERDLPTEYPDEKPDGDD